MKTETGALPGTINEALPIEVVDEYVAGTVFPVAEMIALLSIVVPDTIVAITTGTTFSLGE